MFKRTLLLALILSLFLSSFGFVDATEPRLNLDWPASPLGTEVHVGVDIPTVIRYFYEWMIVLGGLAAFIAFIWAGILYMTSVGDANKMSEAKKKIKRALLGLVLMMSSYLIFYTINPRFTTLEQVDEVRAADIIDDLPPDLRDRINYFVRTYSQCLSVAKMRKHGWIEVPIPLLRIRRNLFPTERESKIEIGYPPSPYFSFIGSSMIEERITGGVRIGNCEVFRTNVIDGRIIPFLFYFNIGDDRIHNYGGLIESLNLPPFPPRAD